MQTAALFSVPASIAVPQRPKTRLVAFDYAPFPYDGTIGRTDLPFFNVAENGRRGHRTPFNRVYWENETYNDPRVLLHIPRGFDIRKPGVIVLFFHGHGAKLERDVLRRQQVPQQISDSGANAVLIAPQLAVDARDSSIGKLWEPGGVKRFLGEAAGKLAQLYGNPGTKDAFGKMPVVIIAYSGGYIPAAWAISSGGLGRRLEGVVLLDALYGETEKFTNWITNRRSGFFVSAYANSTRSRNQDYEKALTQLNIPVRDRLGSLGQGSVVFISTDPETEHRDFVTKAWVDDPIKDLLRRMTFVEHASL
ncbi:MAG: alpha/beta hydrolase [Rhodomicrobiaceae bacterium]